MIYSYTHVSMLTSHYDQVTSNQLQPTCNQLLAHLQLANISMDSTQKLVDV